MIRQPAASVAVLADIHGNLPALRAVLAEADVTAADAVVLLGDIALGPMRSPKSPASRKAGPPDTEFTAGRGGETHLVDFAAPVRSPVLISSAA